MLSLLRRAADRLPSRVRSVIWSIPLVRHLYARLQGRPRLPATPAGRLRAVVHLPDWCRWDHMRQRPQALAKAFADAGHPVYFIDSHEPSARVANGVTIVPRLADTPRSGVILLIHYPPLRELFDRYEEAAVVYDILDDLSIYDPDEVHHEPERRVRAHHPHVVSSANVVTVSGTVLADRHRGERPDLVLVENGVDLERFGAGGPRPTDMPAGPVAGYHGAISHWFDFELVAATARALPHWRFVLVGPVLADAAGPADELRRIENVVFLGEKAPDEIAPYVASFDVGLVPFLITEMTAGVSPLKLFEYLAASVPVVATPLPAAAESPSTVVASSAEEWAAAIEAADGSDPQWRAMAADEAVGASWLRRIEPLLARLDELGVRRG